MEVLKLNRNNILKTETLASASKLMVNVNLSRTNGRAILKDDPSNDGFKVNSRGNNVTLSLNEMYDLSQDLNESNKKWELPLITQSPTLEDTKTLGDKYQNSLVVLSTLAKEYVKRRNEVLDPMLESKGQSRENIRKINQEVNKMCNEARSLMRNVTDPVTLEKLRVELENTKGKKIAFTEYVIVITIQIQHSWNKAAKGGASKAPQNAIVDRHNPNVSRLSQFKQKVVIPYSKEAFDRLLDLMNSEFTLDYIGSTEDAKKISTSVTEVVNDYASDVVDNDAYKALDKLVGDTKVPETVVRSNNFPSARDTVIK